VQKLPLNIRKKNIQKSPIIYPKDASYLSYLPIAAHVNGVLTKVALCCAETAVEYQSVRRPSVHS